MLNSLENFLCLLLSQSNIPKFILDPQLPYIRHIVQYLSGILASQIEKKKFKIERRFLVKTKVIEKMLFFLKYCE